MHDPYFIDMNNPDSGGTYQMVQYIVPILKSKGYTFKRVDEVPDIAAMLPNAKAADGGAASSSGGSSSGDTTRSPTPPRRTPTRARESIRITPEHTHETPLATLRRSARPRRSPRARASSDDTAQSTDGISPEEAAKNPIQGIGAVKVLIDTGSYTDGPVWHAGEGVLFFTVPIGDGDVPGLYRVRPDGSA